MQHIFLPHKWPILLGGSFLVKIDRFHNSGTFRMVQENGRAQMAESPDNLFTGRSIEEIGQIERKIRGDIERKKEELRQMVGERYRPGIHELRPFFVRVTIGRAVRKSLEKRFDRGCRYDNGYETTFTENYFEYRTVKKVATESYY